MERRRGGVTDEWFSQQLDKNLSGCWEWKRCLSRKGYGQFRHDGKTYYTHRYVLEKKLGRSIRSKHMACHSCNNRRCCNPDHIREGTAKENTQDMLDAGRQAVGDTVAHRGEKHAMVKLTEEHVHTIRELRGVLSTRQIAKQYDVSPSAISNIHLRKTWRHLDS